MVRRPAKHHLHARRGRTAAFQIDHETLRGRGLSGRRELLGRPVTEVHRLLLRCLTDALAIGDDRGGGRDIGEAQRGLRRPVQTIQLDHQQPDAGHADVWRLYGAEQSDFVHEEISWCLLLRQIYLQIGLSGRYAFRRFVAGNTHGISGDRNVGAGRIIKRKGQNGGQMTDRWA